MGRQADRNNGIFFLFQPTVVRGGGPDAPTRLPQELAVGASCGVRLPGNPRVFALAVRADAHKDRLALQNEIDIFFHGNIDISGLQRQVEIALTAAAFEVSFLCGVEEF